MELNVFMKLVFIVCLILFCISISFLYSLKQMLKRKKEYRDVLNKHSEISNKLQLCEDDECVINGERYKRISFNRWIKE